MNKLVIRAQTAKESDTLQGNVLNLLAKAHQVATDEQLRVETWVDGRDNFVNGIKHIDIPWVTVDGGELEILATIKGIYDYFEAKLSETPTAGTDEIASNWTEFLQRFDHAKRQLSKDTTYVGLDLRMSKGLVIQISLKRGEATLQLGLADDDSGTLTAAGAKLESSRKIESYRLALLPTTLVHWLHLYDRDVAPANVLTLNGLTSLEQSEVERVIAQLQASGDWQVSGVANPNEFEANDKDERFTIRFVSAENDKWRVEIQQSKEFKLGRSEARAKEIRGLRDELVQFFLLHATPEHPITLQNLPFYYNGIRNVDFETEKQKKKWGSAGISQERVLNDVRELFERQVPDGLKNQLEQMERQGSYRDSDNYFDRTHQCWWIAKLEWMGSTPFFSYHVWPGQPLAK